MKTQLPILSTLKEFAEFKGDKFIVNHKGDLDEMDDDLGTLQLFENLNEMTRSCDNYAKDVDVNEEDVFGTCGAIYQGYDFGRVESKALIKRFDGTYWTFDRTKSNHETFQEYVEDHEPQGLIVTKVIPRKVEALDF